VLFEPTQEGGPVPGDPASHEVQRRIRGDGQMDELLDRSIADLELSVRARNCLDSANLHTLRELVTMSEAEVIKLKNLGKTSLTEIKNKLTELGLQFGMNA
jgi:DNA-directed RNA polymerase subunit alpha